MWNPADKIDAPFFHFPKAESTIWWQAAPNAVLIADGAYDFHTAVKTPFKYLTF